MATLTIPNSFTAQTLAQSAQVNANFTYFKGFIDDEVIQRDGSTALTALLTGPATDPTSDNHLARKAYVDSAVATGATGQVTTTDEAADGITFPVFTNQRTGSQVPHTHVDYKFASTTGILTATGFAGDGASLTALNATNVASGTLDQARLPATISGKTSIGAGVIDAEDGAYIFNSVATDFLDHDQTVADNWAFVGTGDALASAVVSEDGMTFPNLVLNNYMAFGFTATGTGRLRVFVDGVDEGYIQLTT